MCRGDRRLALFLSSALIGWPRSFSILQRFDDFIPQEGRSPDFIGFLQFWSYIIVLSNLVPISLYVRLVAI